MTYASGLLWSFAAALPTSSWHAAISQGRNRGKRTFPMSSGTTIGMYSRKHSTE